MEVVSTPPLTGPTDPDTTLIYFLTCARSGNNGCWKNIFPQDLPSMWQTTVRSHFLQMKKLLGYNNLSGAFPTNTPLLRTGTFLCRQDNHTVFQLYRGLAT